MWTRLNEPLQSLKEYLLLIVRSWMSIIAFFVAVIGAYQAIVGGEPVLDWPIPLWGWLLIALIGLLVGQFLPFHKIRMQRNELQASAIHPTGTWDDPYVPEATLDIHVSEHEFGTSETEGYPKKPANALWLQIYAYFNMSNTILLKSVWVKVDHQRIQSFEWEARTDEGGHQQYHYFEIPKSLTPGTHTAQMVVEGDNKWWASPPFPISVPKL
jgi:hypothetical protein